MVVEHPEPEREVGEPGTSPTPWEAVPLIEHDEESLTDSKSKPAGRSWPRLILGSLASSLCLALGWWVFAGNRGDAGSEESLVSSGGDLEHEQEQEWIPLVPENRRVPLGETSTIGFLEVTPLDYEFRSLTLRRVRLDGEVETKDVSGQALCLRIRLRNNSSTKSFAPIDPAFLRPREKGRPDSDIEVSPARRIALYPLAPDSEWSIVGQDFRTLGPGESLETLIVGESGVFVSEPTVLIWRLRLRVEPDRTETIGVSLAGKTANRRE